MYLSLIIQQYKYILLLVLLIVCTGMVYSSMRDTLYPWTGLQKKQIITVVEG